MNACQFTIFVILILGWCNTSLMYGSVSSWSSPQLIKAGLYVSVAEEAGKSWGAQV